MPPTADDGPFHLELVLSRLQWTTSETIAGSGSLSFRDSGEVTISGSGSGLIAFAYDEVNGNRHVVPVSRFDCRPYRLSAAMPLVEPLSKSGAFDGSEPDADFLRSFLTGPDIRLPAGTWDVTAVATFIQAADCSGPTRTIKASQRITVTG